MVFCGKPSGGCHACRERKTKCDQVPEGCTQCKRAKRKCPGYRVPGDLIFRNESSNVIRKFKAKEAKEKQAATLKASPPQSVVAVGSSSSAVDDDWDISDGSLEIIQREDAPLSVFSLAPTIEERATGFFVANFVLGMSGPSKGYLDYLTDVTRTQVLDDGLLSSMRAVGLAGYAHSVHAPSLLKNARYEYYRALKATNAALRDPVDVKKDTTLLSIMILGIFETITGSKQSSLKDWAQHINGAAAVIKLRGPDQILTPTGRRMMITVTSSLLITCIYRGVPLPKHMQDYMEDALRLVENPDPSFRVQEMMMRFANLRSDILHKRLTDPRKILSRALELDGVLLNISSNPPPGWAYEVIYTDTYADIVYNGQYHLYYDYWMAQIWNALRILRIMLNETMRTVLLAGFSSKPPVFTETQHTAQFQVSTDVIYSLQADILYSVPQHLNIFPEPAGFRDHGIASVRLHKVMEEFAGVRMSGGSFLIWPLWFVGVVDVATDEMKGFVVRNLKNIAVTMGIQQAAVLARIVEEQSEIKEWKEED
ncbi:hypothetical protein DL95DRAFT_419426 [Leptodontidium sp. 2 PMI_412]|nr:hypothetical protein BKA61DRAFT_556088 [Leptodontidium sp. MPI-SDFR-AT-0119]KAH9224476.1 hypothetical protein DL95DRAFT_419426 [Leptodontidium sp. 2 PMI_412]